MKQEFTLLEDGKIKWEHTRDEEDFSDKDFGKLGRHGGFNFIIFDSKAAAMSVLDRDVAEAEANKDKYAVDMKKNDHSLEKFTDIKALIESVGKMHTDFKALENIPKQLMIDSPENQQKLLTSSRSVQSTIKNSRKLLREFNKAKDYIKDEMTALNTEYQKYLNYGPAKTAYDFNVEQYEKILEQKENLSKLK